jgi:putative tryptophan/tyrosine transport system substrate-binding protein
MHRLGRRQLLAATGALFTPPLRGQAKRQSRKMARIGYLTGRSLDFERPWFTAFQQGLRDLGYIEGENILIEQRHAAGRPEKMPGLAAELVRLQVDVLVASESVSAVEAKRATTTIPIVSLTQDPVALGLVASLARPGGNVTGMSDYHAGMASKRLELLKEIVPSASRFLIFFNPTIPPNRIQLGDMQAAAPAMRLTLVPVEIRGADDVDRAFAAIAKDRVDGLVLLPGGPISSNQRQIAALALKTRVPAIFTVSVWAELGGLVSYGTDFSTYFRGAATFVDKILKGSKPEDLPIEQPTKFELVLNLRTAKALGISIPSSILLRADRVIT